MIPIFIGWDESQVRAWNVAAWSLSKHSPTHIPKKLRMALLRQKGIYTRPTETREAGYWDVISEAPMSTGHAIARFLVPHLCGYQGWALFTDGDVLFRDDVDKLFALADPTKALMVVQHQHEPCASVKMTGHAQTAYTRKNWSSVMLFNCEHPSNRALSLELVNSVPGRDLHRFCWLRDDEIGALPPRWNVLIGEEHEDDPAIAHFTLGDPSLPGYEYCEFADEWYAAAEQAGYPQLFRPAPPADRAFRVAAAAMALAADPSPIVLAPTEFYAQESIADPIADSSGELSEPTP